MTTSATVPPLETVAPGLVSRVPAGALSQSRLLLLAVGVIATGASLISFALGDAAREQFLFSYLVAYMFVLSLALGSMFFVLVLHLTRAGWGIVLRRLAENLMGTMPMMAVLFIPIAVGYHTLFHHWVEPDPADHVLAAKSGYLSVEFFFIRAVAYFIVWIGIARYFRGRSIAQDQSGDPAITLRMARVAAPCMFLFAITLTLAAIDWMMTLDPHWFSTIFGVYYFAGCFMSAMCLIGLVSLWLRGKGHLANAITTEHYHDIAKLMFAFMVFWTYIAFSQYMLIWYGNIPEETMWYLHHLEGSWGTVGGILVVGHFFVPFAFLLSRHIKRRRMTLALGAVYLLVIQWIDMHWIIMPTLHQEAVALSWVDFTTTIGVMSLMLWMFLGNVAKAPLVPERDPRLRESLKFINQ